MWSGKRSLPKVGLVIPLLLLLIVAAACGTAAPAEPEPVGEPEAAPVVEATAVPEAVAPPAEIEVHPGKLTIMVGDFGNERWHQGFSEGRTRNFVDHINAGLIADNE
jgi:hypothetical protein